MPLHTPLPKINLDVIGLNFAANKMVMTSVKKGYGILVPYLFILNQILYVFL